MSKKLFFLPALLFGAFFLTVLPSCGDDCKFEQKDYVGQYNVNEDCSASPSASYNVTITAGASETDVKITGFWQLFGNAVNATINCETITIPRQEPDGDKYFVEGSGIIEKNDGNITINITYTVTDETNPSNILTDNCTGTVYTKL